MLRRLLRVLLPCGHDGAPRGVKGVSRRLAFHDNAESSRAADAGKPRPSSPAIILVDEALSSLKRSSRLVLIVSDAIIAEKAKSYAKMISKLDLLGIPHERLLLREDELATLAGVSRLVRAISPHVGTVLAIGGGSVIDTAKLARAARLQPWLLDATFWEADRNVVFLNPRDEPADVTLFVLPTRLGSAAEVTQTAAARLDLGSPRVLFSGADLRPHFLVECEHAHEGLSSDSLIGGIVETVGRIAGPFLITQISTDPIDEAALSAIDNLLDLSEPLRELETFGESARIRNACAHFIWWSATAEHTRFWRPSMPAWWCLQNTIQSTADLPKASLTSRLFPEVLTLIRSGATWAGSGDRINLLTELRVAKILDLMAYYRQVSACPDICAIGGSPTTWGESTVSQWSHHDGVQRAGCEGMAELARRAFNITA